jgi:ABC-type phosphate transport system substrate-binding protein
MGIAAIPSGDPREKRVEAAKEKLAVTRNSRYPLLLILLVAAAVRFAVGQSASDFRVIVHRSNPVNSLSTTEVSQFFLEDKAEWRDGLLVLPVDQAPDSPVRMEFSNEVHGRDVAAVRAHWRRLIFQGKAVPPPTRGSEQEIVQFVSANRSAIGYVSRAETSSVNVKVITLTD